MVFAYLTCMKAACERSKPLATTKVALGVGRENVITQPPISSPADPCVLQPSVAANTSSERGRGERLVNPRGRGNQPPLAGPADSMTTNAPHNKMDVVIARTLIKAEGRE
jgi:hypothetical protein